MALILSARDIEHLQAALRTLLTPLEHERTEDWCRAVCQSVRATLAGDTALLFRHGEEPPTVVADGSISIDAMPRYHDECGGNVTGEQGRWTRGLRAWVPDEVWRTDEAKQSEYYNEYPVPVALRDSAGMSTSGTSGASGEQIVMYVASDDHGRSVPEGREALLLTLLQPGLEAGARTLARSSAPKRILDALDLPLALVDFSGRLIHVNPSFATLLKGAPQAEEAMQAARRLSVELATLTGARERTRKRGALPTITWHSADGVLALDATIWESTGLACGPVCVIAAAVGTPAPNVSVLQGTWGLTRREADVATLLARGCRNREVARTLAISEHTARRHTERVLRKMRASSRAQIAAITAAAASHVQTSASA
jgi:DNA-binding CsgD family transcriptional regulator